MAMALSGRGLLFSMGELRGLAPHLRAWQARDLGCKQVLFDVLAQGDCRHGIPPSAAATATTQEGGLGLPTKTAAVQCPPTVSPPVHSSTTTPPGPTRCRASNPMERTARTCFRIRLVCGLSLRARENADTKTTAPAARHRR
jgi:hypothetical protein